MSKLGRACLIAEQEREGGVSPRTHPQVHPGKIKTSIHCRTNMYIYNAPSSQSATVELV